MLHFVQDHSRTTLRSQSTILRKDTPLLILGGLDGLDQLLVTRTICFVDTQPSLSSALGFSSLTVTAISEIGVSFPDETFEKESRFGIPFTVRRHASLHVFAANIIIC